MAGGRPLKWTSVEEIKPLIDAYFTITPRKEWTITGLALALDTSRETLINYEGNDKFFDTIKKAKEMVHNAYELDLRKQGRSGDIFALKNFGWKDKSEHDLTSGGEKIAFFESELKKLSKDE
jgi:hypothetical protein